VATVQYIDQIFYDERKGTLAHQAMASGDRAMFHLLVHTYRASMTLPAPLINRLPHTLDIKTLHRTPPAPPQQANVYSLLAYAEHRDLWFM